MNRTISAERSDHPYLLAIDPTNLREGKTRLYAGCDDRGIAIYIDVQVKWPEGFIEENRAAYVAISKARVPLREQRNAAWLAVKP